MNWIPNSTVTHLIASDDAILHQHLYVIGDDYDALIGAYIAAAEKEVENILGYPILYGCVKVYATCYTYNELVIVPNAVVDEIKEKVGNTFVDSNVNVETTINSKYFTSLLGNFEVGKTYEVLATIQDFSNDLVLNAIRIRVAELFQDRENRELNAITSKGVTQIYRMLIDEKLHL